MKLIQRKMENSKIKEIEQKNNENDERKLWQREKDKRGNNIDNGRKGVR